MYGQRPFREDRKRRFSEMEQVYCGPSEFLEAGARGFLITTQADKEEFACDDAIDLLRQSSIMLYGGYKARTKRGDPAKGFVKIDFMDPAEIQILPLPEGEEESEIEEEEEEKKEEENEETKDKEEKEDKADDAEGETKDETAEEKEKEETEEKDNDGEAEEEEGKDGSSSKKEKKDTDPKKEKKKERVPVTYMKCIHKFKAYRTELRSVLFIKSNIPDPQELATAAMEVVIKRKSVAGDALIQLLPVYGVCNYDFLQLEIMTQRVLRPMFDIDLEQEQKCYSLMVVDKIAEPGSDLIAETVRNAIWCLNPNVWVASPLVEPDYVLRVELIGSKIVLCCMDNFMKYRQYCPALLVALGYGSPEDDDGTDMNAEMRKAYEERMERERKRKQEAEERRKREEEERKRINAEKRAKDEERRIQKLELKKKREEERLAREEANKKKREERRLAEEAKKKKQEEEKKAEAEAKAEEGGEEEGEPAEEAEPAEEEKAAEGADDSQDLESSQNVDAEMASDTEEDKPKAKRGRRGGRGRGKAKGKK